MKTINVVGCFLKYNNTFLIFLRAPHKKHGGTWGLVAGAVPENESHEEAMVREIKEETGLSVDPDQLVFLYNYSHDAQYNDEQGVVINFTAYKVDLEEPVKITESPSEHIDHKWVTLEECYSRSDLIIAFHELLDAVRSKI